MHSVAAHRPLTASRGLHAEPCACAGAVPGARRARAQAAEPAAAARVQGCALRNGPGALVLQPGPGVCRAQHARVQRSGVQGAYARSGRMHRHASESSLHGCSGTAWSLHVWHQPGLQQQGQATSAAACDEPVPGCCMAALAASAAAASHDSGCSAGAALHLNHPLGALLQHRPGRAQCLPRQAADWAAARGARGPCAARALPAASVRPRQVRAGCGLQRLCLCPPGGGQLGCCGSCSLL